MSGPTEERVQQLEETIAHLSKINEELSTEVAAQWKKIDSLGSRLATIEKQLATLLEDLSPNIENTKPPHW